MRRILKITTTNVFKDDASWLEWKRAMISQLSIVNFRELEETGKFNIESGRLEVDGSYSKYTLEVQDEAKN